ncbi:YfkD famly protein [Shouchella shacheensis]|uniref:YfkD famly protein n=1 Tax=Shouchella shacheensis TaxID=1649580 RepID=UPI00073FC9F2|nr:YfkD famly protein [Shouchella shacheensis]
MKKIALLALLALILSMGMSLDTLAEEADEPREEKSFAIPSSVLSISKENTYKNPTQDLPYLQPSSLAEKLLDSTSEKIENPDLIRIMNESSIHYPKLGFVMKASIYLGEWPLAYDSKETEVNWEYEKVNTNYSDNRGGKDSKTLTYTQEQQKKVSGGLTAKIPNAEAVEKMMMIHAAEKTSLPLSFDTVIGQGTKKNQTYNVPTKQVGYLHGHVPAVLEKGSVTYGEVYLTLKAGKPKLEVKNVTEQGIGAWIPVQDNVSFSFVAAKQPQ